MNKTTIQFAMIKYYMQKYSTMSCFCIYGKIPLSAFRIMQGTSGSCRGRKAEARLLCSRTQSCTHELDRAVTNSTVCSTSCCRHPHLLHREAKGIKGYGKWGKKQEGA
jgi:hypothetical protein